MHAVSQVRKLEKNERGKIRKIKAIQLQGKAGVCFQFTVLQLVSEVYVSGGEHRGCPEEKGRKKWSHDNTALTALFLLGTWGWLCGQALFLPFWG